MNSLLSMEWNAKIPLQWDLESQVMFNAKTTETPRKLQPTADWGIGVGEIDFGPPISSGGAGSGSKSASVNSSLVGESKTHKFPKDFGSKKELANAWPTGTSPMLEASVGSAEPLLDLKLGKWAYLEDVCAGRNENASSCSMIPVSSTTPAKRSKSNSRDAHAPRCQVEGCNLDLSSAKDYHRKHRVCESHSKCPMVIVGGQEHRFCQQCSRFHGLSEFDAKKRSCRKRLSDHNARRRKPQPEPVRVSQAGLSSSVYGARHQMSLVGNRFPLLHTRPASNLTWEGACGSKFTQTKECMFNPTKGSNEEQLRLPHNKFSNGITTLSHVSDRLLPSKGTAAELLNQGLEESIISSNLDTSHDLHSALSLLSTNSWGLSEAKPSQLDHPTMHTIHTGMPQPVIYAMPQGLPLASAEYWETERHPNNSEMHTFTSRGNGSNQFQEFQLFREPFESGFHSNQLN